MQKGTQNRVFLHPYWFPLNRYKAIVFNGGVDGTRTRGLCRDRAAF